MTLLLGAERAELGLVCLEGETEVGPRRVDGLTLVLDANGIAVRGPEPGALRLMPWRALEYLRFDHPATMRDGRPAVALLLGTTGRQLRFLVPCADLPPERAHAVASSLGALVARHRPECHGPAVAEVVRPGAAHPAAPGPAVPRAAGQGPGVGPSRRPAPVDQLPPPPLPPMPPPPPMPRSPIGLPTPPGQSGPPTGPVPRSSIAAPQGALPTPPLGQIGSLPPVPVPHSPVGLPAASGQTGHLTSPGQSGPPTGPVPAVGGPIAATRSSRARGRHVRRRQRWWQR